jgi:hypothetical protein
MLVAMCVGAVVGLGAGIGILRHARARIEAREHDPWWLWQNQWQRVEIGLRRVFEMYEGRRGDSADVLYDLYSFFLQCHHLADWLSADKLSGVSRRKATKIIKKSVHLRVCADLANRTTHAGLTRHWIDSNTSPVPLDAPIFSEAGRAAHRWEITAGDTVYDALDLAHECVAEWRRILIDRGLLKA